MIKILDDENTIQNIHHTGSLSFGEGWGEAFFLPSFGGVGGGFQ